MTLVKVFELWCLEVDGKWIPIDEVISDMKDMIEVLQVIKETERRNGNEVYVNSGK